MFKDLTFLTCSYNTPDILALCLKSFVFHHGKGPHNLIIVENSTNGETSQFLISQGICYLKNPGGTHSPSVDLGLNFVNTKYTLLIDTDIIFHMNIRDIFEEFKQGEYTLMGELQADRGGFLLHPRISPHFCFINMDNVRSQKIRFHNEEKIIKTDSKDFFQNIPINYQKKNKRFYDVGSTFFEEINRHDLKISNIENINNFIFHAESLSWAIQSGIFDYIKLGRNRRNQFYLMAKRYENIDIKSCFKSAIN